MIGEPRLVQNLQAGALDQPTEGDAAADAALRFHETLPGYALTPLIQARRCAEAIGVGRLYVKDESSRLGMPSFKILGASWATYRALRALLEERGLRVPDGLDELRTALSAVWPLKLVAATDGNHGRAVARMARLLTLDAHILVPADIVPARRVAIENEGARVTEIREGYDAAVEQSAQLADARHLVISDTSWPGYADIPGWVIDGYSTIGREVDAQLCDLRLDRPRLVMVQVGVGALAAAVARHFRPQGVTIASVEPARADCVTASIEAGQLTSVPGPLSSIMAGLNCGVPSLVAWPTLSRGLDWSVVIDDEPARAAMRLLAADGIVAGESGAAGLAGLLDRRDEFGVGAQDTVLVLCTEGATDPMAYESVVGRPPADVAN